MTLRPIIEKLIGTGIGLTTGFVNALQLTADDVHTAKLAAIGAAVGFFVTTILGGLKWLVKTTIKYIITKRKSTNGEDHIH